MNIDFKFKVITHHSRHSDLPCIGWQLRGNYGSQLRKDVCIRLSIEIPILEASATLSEIQNQINHINFSK